MPSLDKEEVVLRVGTGEVGASYAHTPPSYKGKAVACTKTFGPTRPVRPAA